MAVTESAAPTSDTPETLEALLDKVRPRLKQVLKKYDIPFQDAEDLLQEACLDLLRKWDTVRSKDAWLVGTLRFKCADYWKGRRTERVQGFDPPELNEISPPQAPEQERTEVLHDLRHLVRGLDDRHLAIVYFRFGLGLSSDEVALRLGYRSSSVRKLAARGLARLQRSAADDPTGR
ncbi:MAG TPA: sigma-70 family RNA polymerase sigma factor [Thermoanaerobaculia bacterium]